jgi:hypothetical protein
MFRRIRSAILRKPNVILLKLLHVAHVPQFHQDYIGLPEDGAPNAPKPVGARWYTNIWLFQFILLVFHSQHSWRFNFFLIVIKKCPYIEVAIQCSL